MTGSLSRWGAALVVVSMVAASLAACGSGPKATGKTGSAGTGGVGASSGSTGANGGASGTGGGNFIGSTGASMQGFEVTPSTTQSIVVTAGQTMPGVMFTATFDGSPASAGWGVDQGSIGSIPAGPASAAAFAPTGTTGGVVNVTATYMGHTLTRKILVKLTSSQNGPNASAGEAAQQVPASAAGVAQLSAGGGVGGVGGEGLGGAVTDMPTLSALETPSSNGQAQQLALIYPYDKTIWPRGMLAPLLMWSSTLGDADAIQVQLTSASGSFSYTGVFGRPAILATTGGKYIRAPIPQDVWDMATNTASGPSDQLTLKLTIAKGGMGYGPVSQTWTVAPARLTGTVYYNSYGTQLVKNWTAPDAAGHPVGAAILGVRSGDTSPTLIVGQNSPLNAAGMPTDDTGCRVCHVVASKGRWLLTQSEQGAPLDGQSYLYDLTATNVQGSSAAIPQQGVFPWAALTSDGSYALTNEVNPSSTNISISTSATTLWQFGAAPASATLTGLPSGLAAGYPTYSPDDKMIAYVDATGSTGSVQGPIVVAAYNAATQAFSAPQTVATPAPGQRIGYPVFLPDDSGILFETQVRSSCTDSVMVTRDAARSELWWIQLKGSTPTPVALGTLNGKGYLPTGGQNHGANPSPPPTDPQNCGLSEAAYDDTTLNYEPTVLPVVAGGYAWVVFTSRRLYGNELTSTPWLSNPQLYDSTSLAQATVKKLWVAAIDLNAPAGTDPSHPAFYLPAQEILAGNSRGFWVLDPCKANGVSCETGDQCCGGFCNGPAGSLVCGVSTPSGCSAPQEKCTSAGDCCDTTNLCINGFCAQSTPT